MDKKMIVTLCLFFSLTSISGPMKFGFDYLLGLGTCIVEYASEWGDLTLKTGVCAFNKATFANVPNPHVIA